MLSPVVPACGGNGKQDDHDHDLREHMAVSFLCLALHISLCRDIALGNRQIQDGGYDTGRKYERRDRRPETEAAMRLRLRKQIAERGAEGRVMI